MLRQTQEWDDEINSILPDRAERIVRELIMMARSLRKSSFGRPQLVFSDGSFIGTTVWGPNATTRVQTLLAQGEQPLGSSPHGDISASHSSGHGERMTSRPVLNSALWLTPVTDTESGQPKRSKA